MASTAARETTYAFLRGGDGGVAGEHDLAVDARTKNNQDHDAEELGGGLPDVLAGNDDALVSSHLQQ